MPNRRRDMKTTHLTISILLALLLATLVTAQQTATKSDPTDLTVVNHSWHRDYAGTQADSNPLQPNEDLMQQTRAEKAVIRQRDYDPPSSVERAMPVPGPRPLPNSRIRREVYVYKLTLKNDGTKRIKFVDWEFQFLHPETNEVLGSRRITSKVKLAPGKTEKIEARLLQQPTHVVSAGQLKNKDRDQFKEQVIIHRIVYSDGSVWERQP
jgi:hypothetical protein